MRRIKYLFTVPEGEKVTEKHFRRVLTSSIISIVLCMSCLFSTTWAWFEYSLEVGPVTIEVADSTSINLKIDKLELIENSENPENTASATNTTDNNLIKSTRIKEMVISNEYSDVQLESGSYCVVIEAIGNASSYVLIEIGNKVFYKNFNESQILEDNQLEDDNRFEFEIEVTVEKEKCVTISVVSLWGTFHSVEGETKLDSVDTIAISSNGNGVSVDHTELGNSSDSGSGNISEGTGSSTNDKPDSSDEIISDDDIDTDNDTEGEGESTNTEDETNTEGDVGSGTDDNQDTDDVLLGE